MTSGEPPAPPSLARFGGFALIGIGVLAAGFGVVAAMTGGTHNASNTAPPVAAPTTTKSSVVSSAPVTPVVPVIPSQPSIPSSSPAFSQGGAGAQNSTGTDEPAARIVIRVYNNSLIQGLASRAADDFRNAGYVVAEVGNYSAGIIPTTTVYYEPGAPGEQAQAQQVGDAFGAQVQPRFDGIASASPGLIAIITDDYKGPRHGK